VYLPFVRFKNLNIMMFFAAGMPLGSQNVLAPPPAPPLVAPAEPAVDEPPAPPLVPVVPAAFDPDPAALWLPPVDVKPALFAPPTLEPPFAEPAVVPEFPPLAGVWLESVALELHAAAHKTNAPKSAGDQSDREGEAIPRAVSAPSLACLAESFFLTRTLSHTSRKKCRRAAPRAEHQFSALLGFIFGSSLARQ
jgi:hypothetical protein